LQNKCLIFLNPRTKAGVQILTRIKKYMNGKRVHRVKLSLKVLKKNKHVRRLTLQNWKKIFH